MNITHWVRLSLAVLVVTLFIGCSANKQVKHPKDSASEHVADTPFKELPTKRAAEIPRKIMLSERVSETPLITAALENNLEQVKTLLIAKGMDINEPLFNGYTALHAAAQKGGEELVILLINSGAVINPTFGMPSPLAMAVNRGHKNIVSILIGHGASLSSFVIETAIRSGNIDILQHLIALGMDTNIVSGSFKATPLHVAVFHGDIEIVKFLVSLGENVNAVDYEGRTPLAVASGNKVISDFLEHHGGVDEGKQDWKMLDRAGETAEMKGDLITAQSKYALAISALESNKNKNKTSYMLLLSKLMKVYLYLKSQ